MKDRFNGDLEKAFLDAYFNPSLNYAEELELIMDFCFG